MALRLGPFKLPWLGKRLPEERSVLGFLHQHAAGGSCQYSDGLDPQCSDREMSSRLKPTSTRPEITSSHVKEMARYFGADLVGIAKLPPPLPLPSPWRGESEGLVEEYPFAVVCAVRAEYDPRSGHGIGGQVPVQNGLFITFVLSAWIRELGFHATPAQDPDAEKLAATAGLGKLDASWTTSHSSIWHASSCGGYYSDGSAVSR